MGITISYRGSIADLDRVEDMEDRLIDLALEVGGHAQVWRSACEHDSRRVVRGLIVDLFPGQEPTSLIISPEGWLVNLTEIEAAEKGEINEPPWCFVKTQFGAVEGHVALVELFACLKNEFMPDLEIRDEGDYWSSRDPDGLRRNFTRMHTAIAGLAEGLNQHGLNPEAAEDPEIVVSRIQQVAGLVHRILSRPAEHPPVRFDDDSEFDDGQCGNESDWDEMFKENRRKQERIKRAIEEKLASDADRQTVFEDVLRDEGLIDLPGEPSFAEARREFEEPLEAEEDEPWKESLPETLRHDENGFLDSGRHPLLQQAMDLTVRLHKLSGSFEGSPSSHVSTLWRNAGEIMGGLAQALGTRDLGSTSGLRVVQLKRALRGAAFAWGSLVSLRAEGVLDKPLFLELEETIKALERGTLEQLRQARDRREN